MQNPITQTKKKKTNKNDRAELLTQYLKLKKAQESFLEFVKLVKPDFQFEKFHHIIVEQMQEWQKKDGGRLMLSMPVRSGKTELCTRLFIPYVFGVDPTAEIMLASHTADSAKDMCEDILKIMDKDIYKQIFPGSKVPTKGTKEGKRQSSEFEILNEKNEATNGAFRAYGMGQGIAGKNAKYLFIDDLVAGSQDASSMVEQERAWKWFLGDFMTRCTPPNLARVCYTGTRWNVNDTQSKIIKQEGKDWVQIKFPLLCEDPRAPFEYRRKVGQNLWPERYPKKYVQKLQLNSYEFACLYQNNPVIRGGNLLKEEWYDKKFVLPDDLNRFVFYFDLGGSNDENSDRTVGTLMARYGSEHKAIVLFQEAFRLNPEPRNNRILSLCQQFQKIYPHIIFYIEAGVGLGVETTNNIQNFLLKHSIAVNVDHVTKSKYDRAQPFLVASEAGNVSFFCGHLENNWQDTFFLECNQLFFVQGKNKPEFSGGHDDIIDSTSSAFLKSNIEDIEMRYLDDVISIPTPEQIKKEIEKWSAPTIENLFGDLLTKKY